jgi:quercetin dioxygenase-like cupin family protein
VISLAKLPQDFTDLLIELCEAKAEFLLVLSGELQVSSEDKNHVLGVGGVAHVPANTKHGYRNLTDTHFLTIVTKGNATRFVT